MIFLSAFLSFWLNLLTILRWKCWLFFGKVWFIDGFGLAANRCCFPFCYL